MHAFVVAVADAAIERVVLLALFIKVELVVDEVAACLEHDLFVLGLVVEEQGGEGERGVVVAAGLDVDAAVGLGVADEEFGGLLDFSGDGIAGLAIGIEHEADDAEAGDGDGFGFAPLAGGFVLMCAEEVEAAFDAEAEFLFEGFVARGLGGLRERGAGKQDEGEGKFHGGGTGVRMLLRMI